MSYRMASQQEQQLQQYMYQMMMQQVAEKAVPSGTPDANYAHGPGGLFSHPALEQPLYSACVTPWTGLQYVLPIRGTVKTDPLYGVITGVSATSGSEPVGVCDDPPTAGLLKLCMATFPLGRESRQTQVIDLSRGDRVTDRGEHTDFVVLGSPTGQQRNPFMPQMPYGWSDGSLSEVSKRLVEFMTAWSRDFARILYTGNPTNNTAQGGYKEPYGLDIIINTGQRDAETGTLCSARDSIVRSFGNMNITTGSGGTNVSAQLVRTVSYIVRNLMQNAAQMNLAPLDLVMAMPFGLFYEITEIWPIAYATYRANQIPTGSTNFVDSMTIEQMRDAMRGDLLNRTGQYLLVDGQHIPVVIDDAIAETTLANAAFASSIYFVPLHVMGGRESTFIEFFDYNAGNVLSQAQMMAPQDAFSISDGGRFLLHKKPPTNFCAQMVALTEWRTVCTTPHLAARLTNIAYAPLMHERSGFTDSNYWVDGGRYNRTGSPSYYSPS